MTSAEFHTAIDSLPALSAGQAHTAFYHLLGGLEETVKHLADGGGMVCMEGILSPKGITALHGTILRAVKYGKETPSL